MQAERVEKQDTPVWVADRLISVGGLNRLGKPMFRVVWGYNRIIKIHGEWQEFEQGTIVLPAGRGTTPYTKLKSSKIETREMPKYLPPTRWFLEKWCPPEDYGTPETWRKAGEEVIGGLTVDTAGPYPSEGDYELVFCLSSNLLSSGDFIPLEATVVEWIIQLLLRSKDLRLQQRKAAIEQRQLKKDNDFTNTAFDIMKNRLRPFAGEKFVTVPGHANPEKGNN